MLLYNISMAIQCPKCKRPNSDTAPRCIYCGQTFSGAAAPAKVAKPKEKPPRSESYLVIVSPVNEINQELVSGLNRLVGWDNYLIKQRLRSTSPWIIRNFLEAEKAQIFLQELSSIGIDCYLVKQSGLDKLEEKLSPKGLRISEEGITFIFEGDEEFSFKYADLLLVVRGRIKPDQVKKSEGGDSERVSLGVLFAGDRFARESEVANDPLEGLKERLGRIKVKRGIVTSRPPSLMYEAQVMDIYLKTSHRGIRVIENEFDFSGMGDMRTDSSLLNFNLMLKTLLERAPEAYFDDDYKKSAYTMKPSEEGETRRLDLLPKSGGRGAAKKLYSSRDSFTDYSNRIYLHYLRQSKTGSGK